MRNRLPFAVADDSTAAFANAYSEYSGAPSRTVSAIVTSVTDWHRTADVTARTGILAPLARRKRKQLSRQEQRARQKCRQYVRQRVPPALGILGWIQIGLWLWRNRRLIAEIIRLFREFLADRPAAFQTVMDQR